MKISFLGYGKEARSAQQYFEHLYPDATREIYNHSTVTPSDAPADAQYLPDDGTSVIEVDADIVVRTPSFDPRRIRTRGRVTSVTEEFFLVCPYPIIGVTGTKGKGTTSSLIFDILTRAGIPAYLLGNIGVPALDRLSEIQSAHEKGEAGVVIYELSSFQLWNLKQSPHIAVVLMISPEHLDIHGDHDEYITAKANIARYQKPEDVVVYFAENQQSSDIAALSGGRKEPYTAGSGEYIVARGRQIVPVSEIGIPGVHNLQNIAAAVTAAMEYVPDTEVIADAVRGFRGLAHRLEVVAEKDGVRYINDSYSSAPAATVAAVRSFDEPKILILGGKDRGLDLEELVSEIRKTNVKHIALIGEARNRIAAVLTAAGCDTFSVHDETELAPIMQHVIAQASSGDVVILSPGFPSFDMFKDFTQRGEQFKEIIQSL